MDAYHRAIIFIVNFNSFIRGPNELSNLPNCDMIGHKLELRDTKHFFIGGLYLSNVFKQTDS
jgi:hypothetical protein